MTGPILAALMSHAAAAIEDVETFVAACHIEQSIEARVLRIYEMIPALSGVSVRMSNLFEFVITQDCGPEHWAIIGTLQDRLTVAANQCLSMRDLWICEANLNINGKFLSGSTVALH